MAAKEIKFTQGEIGTEQFAKDLTRLFGQFLPTNLDNKLWRRQRKVVNHNEPIMEFEFKDEAGQKFSYDRITANPNTGSIHRSVAVLTATDGYRILNRDTFDILIQPDKKIFSKQGLRIDTIKQSAETMTVPWGKIDPHTVTAKNPVSYNGMFLKINTDRILQIPTNNRSITIKQINGDIETTIFMNREIISVKKPDEYPNYIEISNQSTLKFSSQNKLILEYSKNAVQQFYNLWGIQMFTQVDILATALTSSTINSMNAPSFSIAPSTGISEAHGK